MENASKALLIAGAILLAILLIAVAMYVFRAGNSTIQSAVTQMSQQDKDIYNSRVKSYIGENVKGSEVKAMIDAVISMNQSNANEPGKFIGLTATNIKNYNDGGNLSTNCLSASIYTEDGTDNKNGNNTEDNVKNASGSMNTLKSKINSSKNYKVTDTQVQGVIVWIKIEEETSSTSTTP